MEILPRERRIEQLLAQRFDWTERQRQVLDLVARGKSNAEIAESLAISLDGAKWHMREILSKLAVDSREDAAEYWRRRNSMSSRFGELLRALVTVSGGKWVVPAVSSTALVATVAIVVTLAFGGDLTGSNGGALAVPSPTGQAGTTPSTAVPTPAPGKDRLILIREDVAWVSPMLPRFTAVGLDIVDIKAAMLSAMLGIEGLPGWQRAAWIETEQGVIELGLLPPGVDEARVIVREREGESPYWIYELGIDGVGVEQLTANSRLFFAAGSGMVAMSRLESLADAAATALNGTRLPR